MNEKMRSKSGEKKTKKAERWKGRKQKMKDTKREENISILPKN